MYESRGSNMCIGTQRSFIEGNSRAVICLGTYLDFVIVHLGIALGIECFNELELNQGCEA